MDGILFKPYLIKKIVAREKDLTRRLLNPQPTPDTILEEMSNTTPEGWQTTGHSYKWWDGSDDNQIWKPRYHIGQVLFIREAWATDWCFDDKAPNELTGDYYAIYFKDTKITEYSTIGRWRSPLHLPARFARHFIQVKDIREERLQEITEDEAKREGSEFNLWCGNNTYNLNNPPHDVAPCYRNGFVKIWDTINPLYPFASNPHVFRYAFKYLPDYKFKGE
jgi:hypothetical protein